MLFDEVFRWTMKNQAKNNLRRHMLGLRSALTDQQCQIMAQSMVQPLIQSDVLKDAQYVAVYWSMGHEIGTHAIIERLWHLGKHCYLPIVSDDMACSVQKKDRYLHFVHYQSNMSLRKNRYGIPEPEVLQYHPWQHLDIVLLPLLAFDPFGNRLGRGKGYYDATFQDLLSAPQAQHQATAAQQAIPAQKPMLIGLAYAFQQVPLIPVDPWDVKLHAVLTEKEWIFTA